MIYDIHIGDYKVGMLEGVKIHRSVELLADTAVITLPAAEYNRTLDIEIMIKRGDRVTIAFGYEETGIVTEFSGWLQRIGTDGDAITLECEDDLFRFRKDLPDMQYKNISLAALLDRVVSGIGGGIQVSCSYDWTYDKFVVSNATGYDVLKKVQEECGADIYLTDNTLHVHPPGENIGDEVIYDFTMNVQECDLSYRKASDRKVKVVVKALMPDGKVKVREYGSTGGEKVEVKAATTDDNSMKARGESEVKRLSFDGYDGKITTWLVPVIRPGDSVQLHDPDYPYKDGRYFVRSVQTSFGPDGGTREIELGFKLN